MKTEVKIELLTGEKREKRAVLDFCSWTVFSLDFAKAHFGKEGPALLGRHWGSLEKLGWKSKTTFKELVKIMVQADLEKGAR